MMKYRLYIDEVGNSDLNASHDPNHRYLSLTGVIVELGYMQKTVSPQLETLKHRFFGSHPDEPICLHRAELVNRKPPFAALRDPSVEQSFNSNLLNLLQVFEYTVSKEDLRLKGSFERIYLAGTDYVRPDEFARWLISKQLKVKAKSNNIAGLQLADLIAHPSFRSALARRSGQALADNLGGKIARILEEQKYYRNHRGKIDGWGRKWLP